MQFNELREGAQVLDADGRRLGKIVRFVLDPSRREVTHVVVEKGMVFSEERVIPVEAISEAAQDEIRLADAVDPSRLPTFEEHHYVELTDDALTLAGVQTATVPASAWAYPMLPGTAYPAYPTAPALTQVETTRNVPADAVVVTEGTMVVTLDGDEIGRVEEVGMDDDGRVAYLKVDPGFFRSERMVPAHWMTQIREDAITLGVSSATLRRIQERSSDV